ncbi:hypothetical protein D9M73_279090 [compost metagenome]
MAYWAMMITTLNCAEVTPNATRWSSRMRSLITAARPSNRPIVQFWKFSGVKCFIAMNSLPRQ